MPDTIMLDTIMSVQMKSGLFRIVVVEDDVSMSQALDRLLRAGGYQPILFRTAEAGLEAGIASDVACLVLDIHLPGMSGLEFYERLIKCRHQPPAIFITAHDDPSSRERAARLGASGFHPKPFSGRSLLEAVSQALQPD